MKTYDHCNTEFNYDEPLPPFAIRESGGGWEIGAQLATKDGRRVGNAFIKGEFNHPKLGRVLEVMSDVGNLFHMTEEELERQFYRPKYVMDVAEAERKRIKA